MRPILCFTVLLQFCAVGFSDLDASSVLYYTGPGEVMVEGLPLGNGRLGATVLGQPELDGIFINDDTLYAGEPSNTADGYSPDTRPNFDEVVNLLKEGKYRHESRRTERGSAAEGMATDLLCRNPLCYIRCSYQSVANKPIENRVRIDR
jgi:hypothetical protein